MSSFQLVALSYEPFAPLFDRSDAELAEIQARRVIASAKPGFPCRVSLCDAEVGEELLLLPYRHQPGDSPYRASGPIFVRRDARRSTLEPDQLPDYVARRLISVRAYDARHQMTDASVCAGGDCASVIRRMFADAGVAYIHLHNANRGCFACAVERA
jgi:hypothetical protein